MRLSNLVAPIAGAALIGLGAVPALAAPMHGNVRLPMQSSSKLFNFHGRMVAGPFASPRLNKAWAYRLPSELQRLHNVTTYINRDAKKGCKSLLFGSLNISGSLEEYCEDGTNQTPLLTVAGAAGWGIAIQPKSKVMAVGVSGGTVSIYADATNITTPSWTLTLSGQSSGYNAYGLCWDNKGGLYATNWPGNTIDYFANASTGTSTPTTVATTDNNTTMEDYYVSCDFDKTSSLLMVYGFVLASPDPAVVGVVPAGGGNIAVSQTLGSLVQGTGFPGGLTINKRDDLEANDQYGTLYDLGTTEPWNGAIAGSCTWGFDPNDWTNIVYDTKAKETWATNINFGGSPLETMLLSVVKPPLSGACTSPGESGGPTAEIANDEFLGVAVYKASKN